MENYDGTTRTLLVYARVTQSGEALAQDSLAKTFDGSRSSERVKNR